MGKAPLSVGLNLEKTEPLANETAKIIHYCFKGCILGRNFGFTLSAIFTCFYPRSCEDHKEIQWEFCSPSLVPS